MWYQHTLSYYRNGPKRLDWNNTLNSVKSLDTVFQMVFVVSTSRNLFETKTVKARKNTKCNKIVWT